MNIKVFLITGGESHKQAFNFLKNNNYNFEILDDDPNFFLKKKFGFKSFTKILHLKKKTFSKNSFFWSPCNDYGAYLADKYNNPIKYNKRLKDYNLINDKLLQFKKIRIKPLLVSKILNNKVYIKKKRFGSGSRGISIYKKNKYFDKKKFFLQEFINGIEVSLETITINSKHKLLNISYRILKGYKSAAIIYSPKFNNIIFNFFEKKVSSTLNKLGVLNGICHVEAILTSDKKFYPIDINIRTGGAGISDKLLFSKTKLNIVKIDFEILSKKLKNIDELKIKRNLNHSILIFEYKNNIHLKKKLNFFRKIGTYSLLKKEIKNNLEIDDNRVSTLFVQSKLKKKFFKKIEKILTPYNYDLLKKFQNRLFSIIRK